MLQARVYTITTPRRTSVSVSTAESCPPRAAALPHLPFASEGFPTPTASGRAYPLPRSHPSYTRCGWSHLFGVCSWKRQFFFFVPERCRVSLRLYSVGARQDLGYSKIRSNLQITSSSKSLRKLGQAPSFCLLGVHGPGHRGGRFQEANTPRLSSANSARTLTALSYLDCSRERSRSSQLTFAPCSQRRCRSW